MHIDMLKPTVKMRRFAAGEVPKELPEHAFEVIVEPGTRREVAFSEPAINSVKRAFPGKISAPYFFEQKLYTLRYDENGFLAGGPTDAAPDAAVVMLGDSTSEDRYLDEDARTASQVAVKLRASTGKRINVHNAAVSGANSMNSLVGLFVKILPMKPAVATMMHVSNDLKQLLYFGSYWQTFGEPVMLRPRRERPVARSPLVELCRTPYSAARKVGRRLTSVFRSHDRSSEGATKAPKEVWWEYMTPDRGFAQRDPVRLTASFAPNLHLFVSMCRHAGIVPMLLTQPNRLTSQGPDAVLKTQMNPIFRLGMPYEEYKALFDAFNDTVRSVAVERGAALVDLAALVPQEPRFIWDSIHLTEAGAAVAAGPIASALDGILGASRSSGD